MAQGHGGGHGNHVAREQAELHACGALRHAITHGGHTAGHLRSGAQPAGFQLDELRVMLQWRVGRQHVVISGHDANVGRTLGHDTKFVIGWQRGKGVRHIRTTQSLGTGFTLGGKRQAIEVGAARHPAALADACRDGLDSGMELHGILVTKLQTQWYCGTTANRWIGGYRLVTKTRPSPGPAYTALMTSIADLRKSYERAELSEDASHANPLLQFEQWLKEAITSEVPEPNAMTLATVASNLRPS